MEELLSTEMIVREIMEDARKKAQRILNTADEAARSKAAEWEKKTAAALGEMETRYAEQRRVAAHEIMTLLPIDKRRAKAKKIEEMLGAAVKNWYAGLSRKNVLALLQRELAQRLAFCDSFAAPGGAQKIREAQRIRATIHKLERPEAKALLQAVLPGRPCDIEEAHSASPYPELVLETPDARIYASIGRAVEFFISERRAELAGALVGEAALHEEGPC